MSVLEKVVDLFGTRYWSIMSALLLSGALFFLVTGMWNWAIFLMATAAVWEAAWTHESIRDDLEEIRDAVERDTR